MDKKYFRMWNAKLKIHILNYLLPTFIIEAENSNGFGIKRMRTLKPVRINRDSQYFFNSSGCQNKGMPNGVQLLSILNRRQGPFKLWYFLGSPFLVVELIS